MVTLEDIMERSVVTIEDRATALEASRILARGEVDCLLVTRDGEAVGLVTQHDLVCKVVAKDRLPSDIYLDRIMSSPLITIPSWKSPRDAGNLMSEYNIRRILVEKDGSIVGIVSRKSIVDAVLDSL